MWIQKFCYTKWNDIEAVLSVLNLKTKISSFSLNVFKMFKIFKMFLKAHLHKSKNVQSKC